MNNTGKPGTITPEEFELLESGVNAYGARTVASKVAKICSKKADALKHEYPLSSVASAYASIASKIVGSVGSVTKAVSSDFFNSLTGMVALYGPEVVTWKIAKLAKRTGSTADSNMLSSLFPKPSSTPKAAAPRARF